MESSRRLEGKRIIVTGATDGIGQQIAFDAAEAGARIAFCGLPEDDPEPTIRRIRESSGHEPFFQAFDVRDVDLTRQFAREAIAWLGGLDGLVNNVGKNRYTGVAKSSEEDMEWVLSVNFIPAMVMSQECHDVLKASGCGMIVFTSSINAKRTFPGFFPYNAIKSALEALIVSISLEWGIDNIQAVGIAPAMVRTPHAEENWARQGDRQERVEFINSFYPLGRMCETTDISSLAVYLLSGVNRFLTGQVITLDGALGAHAGERWNFHV